MLLMLLQLMLLLLLAAIGKRVLLRNGSKASVSGMQPQQRRGGGRRDDAFREHLLQHLVDFEGKSLCPVCESQCETNKGMQTHFMMVHGQVSRLVCPDRNCVQTFWTRAALEKHKQMHS